MSTLDSLLAGLPWPVGLAVLVGGSFVAAAVVSEVGLRAARRLAGGTSMGVDDALVAELRVPLPATVAVAGAYVAPSMLSLPAGAGFYLRGAALTVAVVVWGYALSRLANRALSAYDESSEGTTGFAPIFQNLLTFGLLIAVGGVVLRIWGVEITPLLASAGIAGIAVGFAAKDTVANFFGSIALYVDDTYRVGDYVVLDSGVAGTVLDISIRSTRLLARDNVVVTVPNSVLNSAQIINHSAPMTKTRVKIPVGVAYGSDLDVVEACLLDAAEAVEDVASNPSPRVRLREFGRSSLDYELLVWVRHPLHDGKATHALNRAIHDRFADAGVEIPFPQRVLHVDGAEATERAADVASDADAERPGPA